MTNQPSPRTCVTCRCYVRRGVDGKVGGEGHENALNGTCRRFPKEEQKSNDDSCFEHLRIDGLSDGELLNEIRWILVRFDERNR